MRTSAYTSSFSLTNPDDSHWSNSHQAVAESAALAYLELNRTQSAPESARDEFLSAEALNHVRVHTRAAERPLTLHDRHGLALPEYNPEYRDYDPDYGYQRDHNSPLLLSFQFAPGDYRHSKIGPLLSGVFSFGTMSPPLQSLHPAGFWPCALLCERRTVSFAIGAKLCGGRRSATNLWPGNQRIRLEDLNLKAPKDRTRSSRRLHH